MILGDLRGNKMLKLYITYDEVKTSFQDCPQIKARVIRLKRKKPELRLSNQSKIFVKRKSPTNVTGDKASLELSLEKKAARKAPPKSSTGNSACREHCCC